MQIFLLKKKINIDHDADEPIRVSSAAELGEGWGGGSGMISIWRRSRQTSKEDERCLVPSLASVNKRS